MRQATCSASTPLLRTHCTFSDLLLSLHNPFYKGMMCDAGNACRGPARAHLVVGGALDGEDVEGHHDAIDGHQHRLAALVHLLVMVHALVMWSLVWRVQHDDRHQHRLAALVHL